MQYFSTINSSYNSDFNIELITVITIAFNILDKAKDYLYLMRIKLLIKKDKNVLFLKFTEQ